MKIDASGLSLIPVSNSASDRSVTCALVRALWRLGEHALVIVRLLIKVAYHPGKPYRPSICVFNLW